MNKVDFVEGVLGRVLLCLWDLCSDDPPFNKFAYARIGGELHYQDMLVCLGLGEYDLDARDREIVELGRALVLVCKAVQVMDLVEAESDEDVVSLLKTGARDPDGHLARLRGLIASADCPHLPGLLELGSGLNSGRLDLVVRSLHVLVEHVRYLMTK